MKNVSTPGNRSTRLTIADICADLGVSRFTFCEWRTKGRGPRCIKLPNGEIRINRTEYVRWLTTLEKRPPRTRSTTTVPG